MVYNPNSGYGEAVKNELTPHQSVHGGKTFLVSPSTHPSYAIFQDLFVPDPDGAVRLFTTLTSALAACVADRGDVIYIAEGYTETTTVTSTLLNVKGVRIIGLGRGLERPTFTMATVDGSLTVSKANMSIENCVFVANFADVAAAITLGAAKDFTVKDCLFLDTDATHNWANCIITGSTANAADGLKVINCEQLGSATGQLAFISILGNTDRLYVKGNRVTQASTSNIGHFITMAALVCLGAYIDSNTLYVTGATNATVGIFITGSSTTSTGMISNNLVTSLDATTELMLTATLTFGLFGNLYTGAKTASGYVLPAIDS